MKRLSQKKRRELVESIVGKVPWDRFEAGIYNYCDRWCEKCKRTKKCYLFWSGQKEDKGLLKKGIDPQSKEGSFEIVKSSFGQTGKLLKIISEAEGIDITVTPEFEAECDERDKLTSPDNEIIYLKACKLSQQIHSWLSEVPSLDIEEYKEAYEKLSWHFILIRSKIARSVRSKKEAKLEKDDSGFHMEDSRNSGYVAYRSTKICSDALDFMDQYVIDSRIALMAEQCRQLLLDINKELL